MITGANYSPSQLFREWMNIEQQAKYSVTEQLAREVNESEFSQNDFLENRDAFCQERIVNGAQIATTKLKEAIKELKQNPVNDLVAYEEYLSCRSKFNTMAKAYGSPVHEELKKETIAKMDDAALQEALSEIIISTKEISPSDALAAMDKIKREDIRSEITYKTGVIGLQFILAAGVFYALKSPELPKILSNTTHLVGSYASYMDSYLSHMPTRVAEASVKFVGLNPTSVQEFLSTMVKSVNESSVLQGALTIAGNAALSQVFPGLSMRPSLVGTGGAIFYSGGRQLLLSLTDAYSMGGFSAVASVIQSIAPQALLKMGASMPLMSLSSSDEVGTLATLKFFWDKKSLQRMHENEHVLRMKEIVGSKVTAAIHSQTITDSIEEQGDGVNVSRYSIDSLRDEINKVREHVTRLSSGVEEINKRESKRFSLMSTGDIEGNDQPFNDQFEHDQSFDTKVAEEPRGDNEILTDSPNGKDRPSSPAVTEEKQQTEDLSPIKQDTSSSDED